MKGGARGVGRELGEERGEEGVGSLPLLLSHVSLGTRVVLPGYTLSTNTLKPGTIRPATRPSNFFTISISHATTRVLMCNTRNQWGTGDGGWEGGGRVGWRAMGEAGGRFTCARRWAD